MKNKKFILASMLLFQTFLSCNEAYKDGEKAGKAVCENWESPEFIKLSNKYKYIDTARFDDFTDGFYSYLNNHCPRLLNTYKNELEDIRFNSDSVVAISSFYTDTINHPKKLKNLSLSFLKNPDSLLIFKRYGEDCNTLMFEKGEVSLFISDKCMIGFKVIQERGVLKLKWIGDTDCSENIDLHKGEFLEYEVKVLTDSSISIIGLEKYDFKPCATHYSNEWLLE